MLQIDLTRDSVLNHFSTVLTSVSDSYATDTYNPGTHVLRTFMEGSLFCVATRLLAEWSGVRIPLGATVTRFL